METIKQEDNVFDEIERYTLDFLQVKWVFKNNEFFRLTKERVNEFLIRCAHDFKDLPETLSQNSKQKVRRILGLWSTDANQKVPETRKLEIEKIILEMKIYLTEIKKSHPEVLWFILCWSRMNPYKTPDLNSDIDVICILNDDCKTDPRENKWSLTIRKLREYSKQNKSESLFEIWIDWIYTEKEFINELYSEIQAEKLYWKIVWWWDSNAIKYIWENLGWNNEDFINEIIKNEVTWEKMIEARQIVINEAKDIIKKFWMKKI